MGRSDLVEEMSPLHHEFEAPDIQFVVLPEEPKSCLKTPVCNGLAVRFVGRVQRAIPLTHHCSGPLTRSW